MTAVAIVLVGVLGLAALAMVGFNRLRRADLKAQEALGGIDVVLTRRADLVPNLIATVKGYAAHESCVFAEVTRARAAVTTASQPGSSMAARAAADTELTRSLVNVLAVAEDYPQLKASESFLQLQTQLAETEDQLAFARQYYNDAVAGLNSDVVTIPWMFFAGMAGVHSRDFYEAPADHEAAPTVAF